MTYTLLLDKHLVAIDGFRYDVETVGAWLREKRENEDWEGYEDLVHIYIQLTKDMVIQ